MIYHNIFKCKFIKTTNGPLNVNLVKDGVHFRLFFFVPKNRSIATMLIRPHIAIVVNVLFEKILALTRRSHTASSKIIIVQTKM